MMLKDSSSFNILFIDTSFKPTWGIFSGNRWLEYQQSNDRKASDYLHSQIYKCLSKHSLNLNEVKIIISAGPGSYTGMRLAQGMKDMFDLSELEVYSFFHFEVPSFLDIKQGEWITKAFKGEVYSYRWNNNGIQKGRKKLDDQFELNLFGEGIDDFTYESTSNLIYENANQIFNTVVNKKSNSEIFYFRTLDEEFPIKKKEIKK